jgi:hypothetical protein
MNAPNHHYRAMQTKKKMELGIIYQLKTGFGLQSVKFQAIKNEADFDNERKNISDFETLS